MSREAFESFMRREHGNMSLDRTGTGEYLEWFVWRTWQAWRVATNSALEKTAEIADAHATCEGIAQRIAEEIRALKGKC